ncbi:MAG: hypothetical protein NZ765_01575, partial [Anaerolineae bacterium]|nr:hypothetical protein [Anaerolineae bacterium]
MKKGNLIFLLAVLLAFSLVAVQCRQPESFTITAVPTPTKAAAETPTKPTEAATEAPAALDG